MKRYLKLSQISLFAGIILTSCLGSKFLKDNEQLLAKQTVSGLSGSLKDDAKGLMETRRNSRLLFGFPMTHLAHIHQLGEHGVTYGPNILRKKLRLNDLREIYQHQINQASSDKKRQHLIEKRDRIISRKEAKIASKEGKEPGIIIKGYDQEKAVRQKDELEDKWDLKIAGAKSEKREKKLRVRKAKKMDKKDRKIKQGNQLMRWGENMAFYNHNAARLSADNIKQYLYSKGYFNAHVTLDTSSYDSLRGLKGLGRSVRNGFSRIAGTKHRYINLEYEVKANQRYFIDSIEYEIEDPILAELVAENKRESPLEKDYYDQEMLSQERDYIYDLAVNNGYYEFSKQYISFKVDSTLLGKDTLLVREIIRNPTDQEEHKIFYLDSIVFVSDASITETYERSIEKYGDVTFNLGKNKYSKKVLSWRIPLEQDDRYSRDQTIETQRQLSFLDNYKFININYDTTGGLFVASIFTSPFDKYQTSSEFGFSSTQGIPGPFFNVNLKNRNSFKALEIISIDLNAKLQDLRNVGNIEQSTISGNYTSRQLGGEISVDFPQFLFPLGRSFKNQIGQFNPKTRLSIGFGFEERASEYTRLEYSGALSYSWQVQDKIRYSLTPAQVKWIDSNNTPTFQAFIDTLVLEGNSFANAFVPAVVTSTSFEREQNFGNYGLGQQGSFIGAYAELGGYFNSLVSNSVLGSGLQTFDYLKGNIDLRHIDRLSRKYNLAFRLNFGYAYAYGDKNALPLDKYFYAGGSSSIRGWKPRRLGPGSFAIFEQDENDNDTEIVDYTQEQPGEILIESSIELRRDLVGFVEGALFLDAGNVWRSASNSQDPDNKSVFEIENFLSEIAVAGGIGVRFDLQFLIFRVDLGMKLVDPAQPKGERFVGDEIFSNFGRNSEFNLGIGYPF